MPKWVWYVAAAFAVYYFFLRNALHATGGANLGLTTGNNVPTGFTGYGAGGYPPGVSPQQAAGGYYGVPLSVGNPTGTSVAQDVANYTQAAAGAVGVFTQLWNTFGGSSGAPSDSGGGGSYGDATYGNDPVMVN